MKVFMIPSWYPSASNPIYGTFVQEQIQLMCKESDELSFGISLWGQGDEEYLLFATQPFSSVTKLLNRPRKEFKHHKGQISHYFSPASTWTNKFQKGNLNGIINANRRNLNAYIEDHGRPDIIHVQASYPGAWVAMELSKNLNVPYIVTLRMGPFPFQQFTMPSGELKSDLKKLLVGASRLVATSKALESRASELGLSKLSFVPNPVDLNTFTPRTSTTSSQIRQVVAIGRLDHIKGFDLLIEAMTKNELDNLNLTIVGAGSEHKNLKKLINDLKLSNQVNMYGVADRTELLSIIQDSDLLVLPSRYETFGNVLLEAMACGKPVVATQCGGPESIVIPETGILCPTENPEALAEAIKQALSKTWDTKKIRDHVEQNFSSSIFTKRMLAIYQDVIDNS